MSQIRERLLQLIDREVVAPVLAKSPTDYSSEGQREKLSAVQEAMRARREMFHREQTAAGIRDVYKNVVASKEAQHVRHTLRELGLPTLPQVEHEFDRAFRPR